ncbi:MAG: thylakoid membrane photosystem I accumulation factor [Leptolyngbyaceae cyanobacterium]
MKHQQFERWQRWLILGFLVVLMSWVSFPYVAWAGLNDDRYDGNIFALYAGNGSIVPPRVTLPQSLKQEKPTLLVFYVDDSSDCKKFASVVSQLQAPYGRVANFVPIMADSVPPQDSYEPTEPGYYFTGSVPQTLVFDKTGTVRLNETGNISYEAVDDVMREVFDLLPRSESVELRRRPINELNTELVEE